MPLYLLPAIEYLRLRFHLKALKDCDLPAWKGSLLRGAFGHALRKTVCTMKPGQLCENCMLRDQCAYTRMFETFITGEPPPFSKGLATSPRPFIFEPHDQNRSYKPGDILWFDLILIGNVIDYVPYVVFSVFQMGHTGLGVGRHPFDLNAAYCFQPGNDPENDSESSSHDNWRPLYDGASQRILFSPNHQRLSSENSPTNSIKKLKLNFLTQTRLKFGNDLTIDFNFRKLTFKLLRRVLELAHFYSPGETIDWQFNHLLKAASDITIKDRNLRWEDYGRYSNRQKTKMKMGGFVGDMTLEGDLSPFLDLLRYSEVLHAGKGTTFGLGRMEIEKI